MKQPLLPELRLPNDAFSRAVTREHSVARHDATRSGSPPPSSDGLTALMETAAQEILVATHWFDPDPYVSVTPITVRFSGQRVGVEGKLQPTDRFIHDETIASMVSGSGPVSVTARIRGVAPGEWRVSAHVIEPARTARKRRAHERATPTPRSVPLIARGWQRWAPSVASEGEGEPVHTCLAPFARVPGLLPTGSWGLMVGLGMVVALLVQTLVIARDHLAINFAWAITLAAIGIGIVGAKVWYIVLQRSIRRWDGWCIQGFILGATGTAALLLVVLRVPAGAFLDATAPGLLLGMAVGRIGCFFAGCCGGPPTAARWGIWSSDQHVGARRVPTQLLESSFCLVLGLGALVLVFAHGPAGGAVFAAGLAAYTLGRQGILYLRAEPRKTRYGGLITALVAALVLLGSLAAVALT